MVRPWEAAPIPAPQRAPGLILEARPLDAASAPGPRVSRAHHPRAAPRARARPAAHDTIPTYHASMFTRARAEGTLLPLGCQETCIPLMTRRTDLC